MPVLPQNSLGDSLGAFERGAIVSEGLMDRARRRRDEEEDRAFKMRERELLAPVAQAKAQADFATAANTISKARYEYEQRAYAAESEMEAQARWRELDNFDPLYAKTDEERASLEDRRYDRLRQIIADFGGLAEHSPTIRGIVDQASAEFKNITGAREAALARSEQKLKEMELEAARRIRERELKMLDIGGDLAVQTVRNQGRGTGTPERLTQLMQGRDRALAEGRTEDAQVYQEMIDTAPQRGMAGAPAAHKSTKVQRYDPFTGKTVSVEAIRNPDGTLVAEDGAPFIDPAKLGVVARYFTAEEGKPGLVPMEQGGFLGLGKTPAYLAPDIPASDRAALASIINDPATAIAYGIDPASVKPIADAPASTPAPSPAPASASAPSAAEPAQPATQPQYPVGTVVEQDGVRYQFDGQQWVEL